MEIYNQYIFKLVKEYSIIRNQLHHSLQDIIAFDWWNYENKNRFLIEPKYSAIINCSKFKKEKDLLSSFRYVRRYEIKNFKKKI